VKVATVAGFPTGATTSSAKATQAAELASLGAEEIDMVAPIGRILDGDWDYVEADIAAVVAAAAGRTVKVILETAILSPTQIVQASAIAMEAGAHFVKTSTGFHPAGGATEDAVALMRAAVGNKLGVKASGGIADAECALRMIAAGATRIGTSKGVELVVGEVAHSS
jgi:deoxyribose-phosphate aldolase